MKQFLLMGLCWILLGTSAASQPKYGNTVTISSPVYEDLYIAGGTVIINAPVHGDLIVAGGTIHINDTITGDILCMGGNVSFNGYVGDDIRCAGGKLYILKNVVGDVVTTGGTIVIGKDVTIGGLLSGGGEIVVDGIVSGHVKTVSGSLVLNGPVMKDVDCRGGNITINGKIQGKAVLAASSDIVIGNDAVFSGGVRYWAPDEKVDFRQSVQNGQAVYDPTLNMDHNRWYYLGFASVVGLLWYAGMVFLFIVIIQYLFGPIMKRAGDTFYQFTLKSMGYGFLFWIGVPIAAVLTFITLIGIPVGLLLMFSYIVLLLLATTIVAVVAANWLNNRSNKNWRFWRLVFIALGIFILLKIITSIPFLGWLIMLIFACTAFGAILLNINWRRKQLA